MQSLIALTFQVYVYVTPKQLIIKEFLLRLIPRRIATFRLAPSTKFSFTGEADDAPRAAINSQVI